MVCQQYIIDNFIICCFAVKPSRYVYSYLTVVSLYVLLSLVDVAMTLADVGRLY